jgi:hypothetical protein
MPIVSLRIIVPVAMRSVSVSVLVLVISMTPVLFPLPILAVFLTPFSLGFLCCESFFELLQALHCSVRQLWTTMVTK